MNCFFRPMLYRSIKEVIYLIYHMGFSFLRIIWWKKPWPLRLLLFEWRHKQFFSVNPLCWQMRLSSLGWQDKSHYSWIMGISTAQHEELWKFPCMHEDYFLNKAEREKPHHSAELLIIPCSPGRSQAKVLSSQFRLHLKSHLQQRTVA